MITTTTTKYKTLDEDDVRTLQEILGKENVIQSVVINDNSHDSNNNDNNQEQRQRQQQQQTIIIKELNEMNQDWQKKYFGKSKCAIFPRNANEISKVLEYCSSKKIAICPQGGNTGLVGGGVPVFDEVILSMKRMNSVISIDNVTGVCVCEAGVILEELDDALLKRGMTVPLDLGAKGKCQIGGNVSTNAGGLRLVKYGSLRGTVLGLEVVLADGTVLSSLLRENRKDNTGYDLKQLFIGAEGTLGIITKVAILAPRAPAARIVTIFGCETFRNAVDLMVEVKRKLAENLSAVEFFDRESLELTVETLPGAKDPFPINDNDNNNNNNNNINDTNIIQFYVAVETTVNEKSMEDRLRSAVLNFARAVTEDNNGGAKNGGQISRTFGFWKPRNDNDDNNNSYNNNDDSKNARSFGLNGYKKNKLVKRFLISENEKQANELWNLRERISVALKYAGAVYKYDVSLPTIKMYELVDEMRNRFRVMNMDDDVKVLGYGHLGDGNLHLNISRKKGPCEKTLSLIEPFVYDYVTAHKGSVSAEHGLGAMKVNELWRGKDHYEVKLMQNIKNMFDPKCILNPYKMIPSSFEEDPDSSLHDQTKTRTGNNNNNNDNDNDNDSRSSLDQPFLLSRL
jgi:D-2-hydroxyglutarate dehydrogenase